MRNWMSKKGTGAAARLEVLCTSSVPGACSKTRCAPGNDRAPEAGEEKKRGNDGVPQAGEEKRKLLQK